MSRPLILITTYYWESARGAEIDFVIQRDGQLIPIEVKSADNTKAKRQSLFMPHFAYELVPGKTKVKEESGKKNTYRFLMENGSDQ